MKRKRQPVFFKLGESKHDPADDQWEHSYTVYYDDETEETRMGSKREYQWQAHHSAIIEATGIVDQQQP